MNRGMFAGEGAVTIVEKELKYTIVSVASKSQVSGCSTT